MTPTHTTSPPLPDAQREARSRVTPELLDEAHRTDDPQERARLLDEVVVVNCRIADAVALRYAGRGVATDDLRQAAYEGLIKAVARFDPDRGVDLLSFAVPTITGELRRYFRDRAWMVRPPRRVQDLQWQSHLAVDRLVHDLGRQPTHAEIRASLGLADEEYAEVVAGYGCFSPPSLDQGVGEGGTTLGDLLVDGHDAHLAAEARCMLEPLVRSLSPRDRLVVHLRFFEGRTQREIGEELGVTQTQVSRILDRILLTLRGGLEIAEDPARPTTLPTPA